jgi:hypothetical protein
MYWFKGWKWIPREAEHAQYTVDRWNFVPKYKITGKYTHQQQSQQHLLHFESILLHLLPPPPWHCLLHHCEGNFVSSSKIVETAKANLEHFEGSVLSCGIFRWLKMKVSCNGLCDLVVGPNSWYVGLLSCQTLLFNTGCSMMQRFS